MNRIPLISALLILIITVTGCFKQEEAPLMIFDGKETHTLQQLFSLHNLGDNATLITDSIIITGIVVSTDQYGSCYKEIFIQDETGGISIRTSNTAYYNKYRVGQRVYVKCKDLYLGSYISGTRTGWYQLGLWGNGQMQYIPTDIENRHVFRSEIPNPKPEPKIIRNASDNASDVDLGRDYHTLVKLTNCTFVDANGSNTYYDISQGYSSISRNIKLESGNKNIIARISMYCTFGDSLLPTGPLNITGILSMFGSDIQLFICSLSDVEHLSPPGAILAKYDMSSNPFDLGWTNKRIQGNTDWIYRSLYKRVGINGTSGEQTECSFVSPKLDFNGKKNVTLYFTSENFNDATTDNLQLQYTANGTNWQTLPLPLISSELQEIAVSIPDNALTPDFQIAFRYRDNRNSGWTITNIEFRTK